ncbi:MAG: hypothetical protein LEGION0398_MBIBDBAK_01449 [Legionellaceae bacterium]
MKCFNCKNEAVGVCSHCFRGVCNDCSTSGYMNRIYCLQKQCQGFYKILYKLPLLVLLISSANFLFKGFYGLYFTEYNRTYPLMLFMGTLFFVFSYFVYKKSKK